MKRIGIVAILLISVALNFVRLGEEGFANLYYAAGVKSMMMNWHNLFFVSFDPGGFITIDKPPLGFWLQTLSAKIFGFQGWSLILPQALGGVMAVYLTYLLVRRYHGEKAGLLSALILALTPIFVAASRNNTIDVLLVMTLLAAVWVFLPATEGLNLNKLLLAFFLIGVGFNIKSLEAYMILPAFYITYFFSQHGDYKRKALHLLLATMVLAVSSLPWFIAVDRVPPENRPYVGSSETNSELELATGYNGLGHFLGYGIRAPGRTGGIQGPRASVFPGSTPQVNPAPGGGTALSLPNGPLMMQSPGNMRQAGGETGKPGPLRLFNRQMGGQISWLLPLALIGIVLALYQLRKRTLTEKSRMKLLFWSSWLIPQIIFFSIAQGTHRYYLVMMAPAIAALVGISYRTLAIWATRQGKKRYLLPLALIVTIGVQAVIIAGYDEWRSWMLPTVLGAGVLVVVVLGWQAAKGKAYHTKYSRYAVMAGVISMLIAPFAWSLTPVLYGSGNAAFPFAGPDLNPQTKNTAGLMASLSGRFTGVETAKLEEFLMTHYHGEKYSVAVPNAQIASPIILNTGLPVMTYGGFMGSEKILNAEKLVELVATGQIRYIMLGSAGQQPEVDAWVKAHGIPVPDAQWQRSEQVDVAANRGLQTHRMIMQLYDCRP